MRRRDKAIDEELQVEPLQEEAAERSVKEKPFDIDTFQIKTLADFDTYNAAARKLKRPVKVPDASYHKHVKVKFQRFDQPENVLKVWVRNKAIDWKGQLKPGKIYDLPMPVVAFLNRLVTPIFAEVKSEEGGSTITETKQVGERNRFSCQQLEFV